jgi:hypothetical protein
MCHAKNVFAMIVQIGPLTLGEATNIESLVMIDAHPLQ